MRERKHGCFLILHLGGFRGGLEGNYPEFKIPGWLVLYSGVPNKRTAPIKSTG